jgi:GT2 family glycosyltransferase
MSEPLLQNRCEAVAGRVILAETLRRDWFTPMHEVWLACIGEPADCSPELIGASMGIHRSVFDTITGFDEELGPGASGYGEETLLWRQMQEARMRILPVRDTHVVHHPDEDRLLRSSWRAAALSLGRGEAYVRHHWFHHRVWFPRMRLNWLRLKLWLRGLLRVAPRAEAEGCDAWEMTYWYRIEALKCSMREERRPRNYECRGLSKRAHG